MNDRLTRTSIPAILAIAVARATIKNPSPIGRHRAQWLCDLALSQDPQAGLGRQALQAACKAAGRHTGANLPADRVFNRASNRRLRNWSQDRNSPV